MGDCIERFCNTDVSGRELQKAVDLDFPNFACEGEICSPFSPGPVSDDEIVAFILIDPLHYDTVRGVVVPDAFQELTNRDLSLLRVGHATKEEASMTRDELVERGATRIPPQFRLVNEVCLARAVALRTVRDTDRRLLAIYDTALDKVRSHASAFTRADVLEDRRLRKVVRNRIHEVFTKHRITFDEFWSNLAAGN